MSGARTEPYAEDIPEEYDCKWACAQSDAWLIVRGIFTFGGGVALLVLMIEDMLPGQWAWLALCIPLLLVGLTMIICGWAAPCYVPQYDTKRRGYLSLQEEERLLSLNLPFDAYMILGSHNSCHVANLLALFIAPWRYTHAPPVALLDMGLRSVELDIWYSRCSQTWRIVHEHLIDGLRNVSQDRILAQFQAINDWSNKNPGHFPLILNIDIKGSYGMLPWLAVCIGRGIGTDPERDHEALTSLRDDATQAFGSKLFTPNDLGKGQVPLVQWLATNPWPSVERLKGKIMLHLNIYSDRSDLRHSADHGFWWVRAKELCEGECIYSEKDGDGTKRSQGILSRFSAWTGGELCCINGVSAEEETKGREKMKFCIRGEGKKLIASDHFDLFGKPSIRVADDNSFLEETVPSQIV